MPLSGLGLETRSTARELMDDPVDDWVELEENLRDIERTNRWFGGIAAIRTAVFDCRARTMLDVGCGSADVALALVRAFRRRGRALDVTCLDRSDQMLAIARGRAMDEPSITFVQADGEALPFRASAFDAVTCNLVLHHFDPPAAVRLLRELRRVAKRAPIVCDLRRSRLGYLAALAYVQLASRNRLTRHDAPLSVRRAYTPDEALDLARSAGWRRPTVRHARYFRMILTDEE
jgi:ubiquinone/menaquinone biosynthesis C-methylase UbiE